jgi:hypothetical protein
MNTQDNAASALKKMTQTVILDEPIPSGEGFITQVEVSRPNVAAMLGISAMSVLQFDFDTMVKLIPRITNPQITALHIKKDLVSLPDMIAIHAEAAAFLLPKGDRPSDTPTE